MSVRHGLHPNRSEEHFLVHRDMSTARRVFTMIDKGGEELKGSWYPEEVQEIAKIRFLIEKGIRKGTIDKGEQVVPVSWKGWPQKFNTWIPASDLEHVT